ADHRLHFGMVEAHDAEAVERHILYELPEGGAHSVEIAVVVEADESDGTFLKLPADVAVITNIDPEHLDHYGNFDAVRAAFRQFVE
ncbi:Mur ligase family protein, partial [Rhizobium brockwellii]|uniref:Mur ligase family protein n=1 Tax=Rhizobium brockwellii TaxID=3019932 RepID=UPI003F950CE7